MKLRLLCFFIVCLTVACKKESAIIKIKIEDPLIASAKFFLAKELTKEDFNNLDWAKARISKTPDKKDFMKIPLLPGKTGIGNCIFLFKDNLQWQGNWASSQLIKNKEKGYSGIIKTVSFNKADKRELDFKDNVLINAISYNSKGKINYSSSNPVMIIPVPVWMGTSLNDYWNLSYFISGGGGGTPFNPNYYGECAIPMDFPDLGNNEAEQAPIEMIEVEFDFVNTRNKIDLQKYFNCFNSISNVGATYSVTLYADIPVNGNPSVLMDWTTGSPGHSFLKLEKTNGNNTVQQIFGFYPNQGWLSMFYIPVSSAIVDDSMHEYNASIDMNNITLLQFQTLVNKAIELSSNNYDIDGFNCAEFALEVFNSIRPNNPIIIPLLQIPGAPLLSTSFTPQGLYSELFYQKNNNANEASNISIPGYAGYVGSSHGPCN